MAPRGGTVGLARIVLLVDRYGEAIEYDLHDHFGLDILDFFRGRYSWRKLRVLIDQLPPGSAFWAARAGDVEAAEAYIRDRAGEDEKKKKPHRPELRDLSPEIQQLIAINDRLAELSAKQDLTLGHPSARVDVQPRPLFAVDIAKARLERQAVDSLVSEVDAAIARSAAKE